MDKLGLPWELGVRGREWPISIVRRVQHETFVLTNHNRSTSFWFRFTRITFSRDRYPTILKGGIASPSYAAASWTGTKSEREDDFQVNIHAYSMCIKGSVGGPKYTFPAAAIKYIFRQQLRNNSGTVTAHLSLPKRERFTHLLAFSTYHGGSNPFSSLGTDSPSIL